MLLWSWDSSCDLGCVPMNEGRVMVAPSSPFKLATGRRAASDVCSQKYRRVWPVSLQIKWTHESLMRGGVNQKMLKLGLMFLGGFFLIRHLAHPLENTHFPWRFVTCDAVWPKICQFYTSALISLLCEAMVCFFSLSYTEITTCWGSLSLLGATQRPHLWSHGEGACQWGDGAEVSCVGATTSSSTSHRGPENCVASQALALLSLMNRNTGAKSLGAKSCTTDEQLVGCDCSPMLNENEISI